MEAASGIEPTSSLEHAGIALLGSREALPLSYAAYGIPSRTRTGIAVLTRRSSAIKLKESRFEKSIIIPVGF